MDQLHTYQDMDVQLKDSIDKTACQDVHSLEKMQRSAVQVLIVEQEQEKKNNW